MKYLIDAAFTVFAGAILCLAIPVAFAQQPPNAEAMCEAEKNSANNHANFLILEIENDQQKIAGLSQQITSLTAQIAALKPAPAAPAQTPAPQASPGATPAPHTPAPAQTP
jgi:hypothetical protein